MCLCNGNIIMVVTCEEFAWPVDIMFVYSRARLLGPLRPGHNRGVPSQKNACVCTCVYIYLYMDACVKILYIIYSVY